MTKDAPNTPSWATEISGPYSNSYETVWREMNQVLSLWINALPRHHALALPVAVLLAGRLIAVTVEAALENHASETRS